MAKTELIMVRWAMGVSLLEHRRNEEILEEAKVEPIATVMRRRRLEWFRHVKRRNETENIRAVAEMKMEGKRPKRKTKVAVVRYSQKGPESLENEGGMRKVRNSS